MRKKKQSTREWLREVLWEPPTVWLGRRRARRRVAHMPFEAIKYLKG